MPLQNRVTPFGDIVALPQRGLFTGNRGILHDPAIKTLLGRPGASRRWASKAWLICVLEFKGRRRDVMGRRSWTELFFLDEATALAAGHRPCFHCRRQDANAFRAAWAEGNGAAARTAPEIDAALHRERLDGRNKRLHALPAPLTQLPDGAMVASAGASYLILAGKALRWSPAGYAHAHADPSSLQDARLLTPPSTVRALAAGYRATLHPSAFESS
jgi:hypothetical protein